MTRFLRTLPAVFLILRDRSCDDRRVWCVPVEPRKRAYVCPFRQYVECPSHKADFKRLGVLRAYVAWLKGKEPL